MPYTDWKEWATKRPDWMQQDVAATFERFVEKKWQDALNVAAAEPASWNVGREKSSPNGGTQDKTAPISKGTLKVTGAVNVVEQKAPSRSHSPSWDVSFGRKCWARNLIGCDGDHVLLQCDKLLSMKLSERKEILEKSGLCLFCLKHAAKLECYGRGGLSKPRCTQAECDREHTPGVHKLMGEESVSVNLVAEDECELEEDGDEEWWVGTVRAVEVHDEEEEALEEIDESEPEGETQFITSIFTRKDDSGLEDEFEYPWDVHALGEPEEDRWWSPEPPQPSSEEDEEEVQYLVRVLGLEPQGDEAGREVNPSLEKAVVGPREEATTPGTSQKEGPPHPRGAKRKRLRKKVERTRDQEWEQARQDAWLREMLTDTSESENEERCGRFAESGRWITELFRIPQYPVTTSGGECSRQKMPDSS
jgi:hypothetical protein